MDNVQVAFHWSGGKDSALALSVLLAQPDVRVDRLVTTVHDGVGESTVHGIPVALLEAQARSIGIELQTVQMPGEGLDGYVEVMQATAHALRREGVEAFAFGDLTCSDVLRHKQKQFEPLGLHVLEPLWDMSSREVIEAYLRSGIRAVTVVVDASVLEATDVGVLLDREFVDRLPASADPCGELGEYHTFAYDGPLFATPVRFEPSEPRRFEREIATTDGMQRFAYWLAPPREPGVVRL